MAWSASKHGGIQCERDTYLQWSVHAIDMPVSRTPPSGTPPSTSLDQFHAHNPNISCSLAAQPVPNVEYIRERDRSLRRHLAKHTGDARSKPNLTKEDDLRRAVLQTI